MYCNTSWSGRFYLLYTVIVTNFLKLLLILFASGWLCCGKSLTQLAIQSIAINTNEQREPQHERRYVSKDSFLCPLTSVVLESG